MSAVPVAGSFAVPALKLRRMVALSPTWKQAIAGLPSKPEAPDRVWLKNALGIEPRPLAVVSLGDEHSHYLIAGGDHNHLRPRGSLVLYLSIDTPPEFYEDAVSAEFFAGSFFGQVIDDVVAISAADDPDSEDGTSHLSIVGTRLQDFDETAYQDANSLSRFYWAAYAIAWGDGDGGA